MNDATLTWTRNERRQLTATAGGNAYALFAVARGGSYALKVNGVIVAKGSLPALKARAEAHAAE
jgi:hypothetical protein